MQEPTILKIPARQLIGMHDRMSLKENTTPILWKKFRTTLHKHTDYNYTQFYSIQQYDNDFDLAQFTPETYFKKWAAVDFKDTISIPKGIEIFTLVGGLYAVFLHKGPASAFFNTFNHIFTVWLPNSNYKLDQRVHFEILGQDYKPNDPNAEEEVWIPIKEKKN